MTVAHSVTVARGRSIPIYVLLVGMQGWNKTKESALRELFAQHDLLPTPYLWRDKCFKGEACMPVGRRAVPRVAARLRSLTSVLSLSLSPPLSLSLWLSLSPSPPLSPSER